MILTYHNRGVGRGSGPVEYLLGKDYDRQESELLRGDPDQTIDLIDSLDFNKKYTSGVLAFTENDLPGEVKNKIMDDFERATFSGMDKDQYSILWVQHQDKGNLELNFVIPNVELNTGKRFQPYYHKADKTRMHQFRDIQNTKYDLGRPDDPERKQTITMSKNLPKDKKQIVERLNNFFVKGIEKGTINDRKDIIDSLSAAGFKVARETDKSISIENPNGGQNIRLKGAIYERSFGSNEQARRERQADIGRFKTEKKESYRDLCERHERYIERKSEVHKGLYNAKLSNDMSDDRSRDLGSHMDLRRDPSEERSISYQETQRDTPGIGLPGNLGNNTDPERGRGIVPGTSKEPESLRMGRDDIHTKEVSNDRNRETISRDIEELSRSSRESGQRLQRSISSIRRELSSSKGREQDSKRRRELFGKAGRKIDERIGQIKRTRSYNRSRDNDRGMGW